MVSWVGSNSYLAMLKNMAKINMLKRLKILQDDNAKKSMMNLCHLNEFSIGGSYNYVFFKYDIMHLKFC